MKTTPLLPILVFALAAAPILSAAPPQLVKDIFPGPARYTQSLTIRGLQGESVLYTASHGIQSGLFRADGTEEGGTVLLLAPVTVGQLVSMGGQTLFSSTNALWKTDGTPAGTTMLKDIAPGGNAQFSEFTVIGSTLYFAAIDATNGKELWKSDGTPGGTLLSSPAPVPTAPRQPVSRPWAAPCILLPTTARRARNSGKAMARRPGRCW